MPRRWGLAACSSPSASGRALIERWVALPDADAADAQMAEPDVEAEIEAAELARLALLLETGEDELDEEAAAALGGGRRPHRTRASPHARCTHGDVRRTPPHSCATSATSATWGRPWR